MLDDNASHHVPVNIDTEGVEGELLFMPQFIVRKIQFALSSYRNVVVMYSPLNCWSGCRRSEALLELGSGQVAVCSKQGWSSVGFATLIR